MDRETSKTNVQMSMQGPQKGVKFYETWADTYDKDLSVFDYVHPQIVAEELAAQLGERKQARILDVAAGTGLVASHLKNMGFQNVDAVDASPEMLEKARGKHLYKNIYCEWVTDKPIPGIENDTYDGLLTTGSFAPNHLKPNCLKELIRMVKSGGAIVIGVTASYLVDDDLLKTLEPTMNDLITEGLWTLIEKKEHGSFIDGKPGFTFAFSVV